MRDNVAAGKGADKVESASGIGTCDADILRAYPALQEENLENAWNYYQHHRDEIEQQIRDNEKA